MWVRQFFEEFHVNQSNAYPYGINLQEIHTRLNNWFEPSKKCLEKRRWQFSPSPLSGFENLKSNLKFYKSFKNWLIVLPTAL